MVLVLVGLMPIAALLLSVPILCPESGGEEGDVIVVLGGEMGHRAPRALELYEQGAAPRIIISGAGDSHVIELYLERQGVPEEVMEIEDQSISTKQNAEFCVPLLRARHANHVLIVTSWFHARRALRCFRHYAPEIEFSVCATVADRPKSCWPNRSACRYALIEYFKLADYWVLYGISPF